MSDIVNFLAILGGAFLWIIIGMISGYGVSKLTDSEEDEFAWIFGGGIFTPVVVGLLIAGIIIIMISTPFRIMNLEKEIKKLKMKKRGRRQ